VIVGLLDPAYLLPCRGPAEESQRRAELDAVAYACRLHSVALPPFDVYWPALVTMRKAMEAAGLRRDTLTALQEIFKLSDRSRDLARSAPLPGAKVWRRGFKQLFEWSPLDAAWADRMTTAAVRAAACSNNVVLFARPVDGRNVRQQAAGGSTIHVCTRWVLHIQPKQLGHRPIKCAHHARNISLPWTIRFDWRLPASEDGARYPFCPPDAWWKQTIAPAATRQSKPCFVDRVGNGWARPNVPGGAGHHWDVYLADVALADRIGLNPINITAFGTTDRDTLPGDIHHVPSAARPGWKADPGWTCE